MSEQIDGFDSLKDLALDLRWSWNDSSDEVWRQLDPELWELTHNPWVVLQTASRDKIRKLLADPAFRANLDTVLEARRKGMADRTWFQKTHPDTALKCTAYFSMEFMLSEALPIYSGGLGNVAGDQLKAASDLGVPVVGVGLLYQQGYFRQIIDNEGAQEALYPYNEPGQLPITALRQKDGEWLRLEVKLPGYSIWLRTWQVQVGSSKLYLLDSNDAANFPAYRGITSGLYAGGPELRLQQEILLGIGGWRLLQALGITPEVCHLNEGHAAFATLERAHSFMQSAGKPFHEALATTRAGNLFTTHTAVPAGFDRFPPALIEHYLGAYAQSLLGIGVHDLLALGRQNPDDSSEKFNMAYLAVRGCGAVSGVSRLHGQVSRQIFQPLFPNWPEAEVPVGYVTNGVHVPTWDSAPAGALWTEACGKDRWLGSAGNLDEAIRAVPDRKVWQLRTEARKTLVEFARARLSRQFATSGASAGQIESAKHLFDPNVLTLGFARRFATYKRPDLLLHDPERLVRILTNAQHPVQLIIAGKAHPADRPGQDLIQKWVRFTRRPDVRPHVIFLSDYDMQVTRSLVQGVDVWMNTPRRPWEACGTSGMKVLVNGGINLSELDGWWLEAYTPDVGWALGDGKEHGEDPAWDASEAEALYGLLERNVIPEFYNRDPDGIPSAWVARVRESMAKLTPQFSATRAVREYTERHYIPGAAAYSARAADRGAIGQRMFDWEQDLNRSWAAFRFGEVKVESNPDTHTFEVRVFTGSLDPSFVRVELFAEAANGHDPSVRQEMKLSHPAQNGSGALYTAAVPASRGAGDYTARMMPAFPGAAVPLESTHILWQHQ
jgi:starch phosphorylase